MTKTDHACAVPKGYLVQGSTVEEYQAPVYSAVPPVGVERSTVWSALSHSRWIQGTRVEG